MISQRTKAGLTAAKTRGKKLGGLNEAGIARRAEAVARAEALRPLLEELAKASMSMRAMTEELNKRGVPTLGGGKWYAMQVLRVLERLKVG